MLLLLLFVSFHCVLLVAVNEVTQFGFHTFTLASSRSQDNFIVTLWFNHTIYQNQFNSPSSSNRWFRTTAFTILGSSHCEPESKIMFEQIMLDTGDSLKFDTIEVNTESGDFYGIRSSVTDEFMCLDTVGSSCAPPKQIFYFDISRPNTYIEDAAYMDATSVIPQIESCEPTAKPSIAPSDITAHPSIAPSDITAHPSIAPSDVTGHPTIAPSDITAHPSIAPSDVTGYPTIVTAHPTIAPSDVTAHPTIAPSDVTAHPSFAPSGVTAHPTESPTRDPFKHEQFTIEIKLNSCTDDGSEACAFDATEDEINTILIAHLDETVSLIGTVIEGNTVRAVLSMDGSDGFEELDRDQITDGIENELEREYGQDVEVTITKNEDGVESIDDDEPNPWNDVIELTEAWITYIVAVAIAIPICLLITLCLCCYFRQKRKVWEARGSEQMIAMESAKTGGGGNDTECKDTHDDTHTVVALAGGKDERDANETDSDDEELYDHVESVVTTKGARGGEVNQNNDNVDRVLYRSKSEELYDHVESVEGGGTTKGEDHRPD